MFRNVLKNVHVNLPVFMFAKYFRLFSALGINPEIGLDTGVLDKWTTADFAKYAKKLQARKVQPSMHAPFMGLNPGSSDPADQEHCRHYLAKTIAAVAIFRPHRVVWHTCIRKSQPYYQQDFVDNLLPTLAWFAQGLAQHDAQLVVENTYEPDARLLLELLPRLKPYNVGFCLDTGHSNAFAKKPLTMWLESELMPYLAHIHMHDNKGNVDAHLGMGRGNINYTPLLNWLKSNNHTNQPSITLEPHTVKDLLLSLKFANKYIYYD